MAAAQAVIHECAHCGASDAYTWICGKPFCNGECFEESRGTEVWV